MIKIVFVLSLMFNAGLKTGIPDIGELRLLYQKAAKEEKYCRELFDLLKTYTECNEPLLLGYRATASMMMAKYVSNPFSKLNYFKKGKYMMEKAIAAEPGNIELRFLRLSAQTHSPSFLGYNKEIDSDRIFLMRSLPGLDDPGLKKSVILILKTADQHG